MERPMTMDLAADESARNAVRSVKDRLAALEALGGHADDSSAPPVASASGARPHPAIAASDEPVPTEATMSQQPHSRESKRQRKSRTGSSHGTSPAEAGRWRWKRVGYVTDVEGNMAYFRRWVAISTVLSFDEAGQLQFDSCDDAFVFGGDAFDKGPGDMELAGLLVDVKRRHPDRVFLLIGNRDANKLRLATELSDNDVGRPASSVPTLTVTGSTVSLASFLAKHELPNDKDARLKWLLHATLGSPKAYEFRRDEMLRQRRAAKGAGPVIPTDAEVTASFVGSVLPGGFVYEYLRAGQLAVLLGDTLFVHGGLEGSGCRWIPDLGLRYFDRETGGVVPPVGRYLPETAAVSEWVDALNTFAAAALDQYDADPCSWASDGARGGEALMAYQSTPATKGRGVVVPSFVADGAVRRPDPEVVDFLKASGVSRMVVGHKPVGNSPLIIRDAAFEVVMADTSYSDGTAADMRGIAVADITVLFENPALHSPSAVSVHGVLHDTQQYGFDLPPLPGAASPPASDSAAGAGVRDVTLIGRCTADGYWIKAKFTGRDSYLIAKTEGHRVSYRAVQGSTLRVTALSCL